MAFLLNLPHTPRDPQTGAEAIYESQGPIGFMENRADTRHLIKTGGTPYTLRGWVEPDPTDGEMEERVVKADRRYGGIEWEEHVPTQADNIYVLGEPYWNATVLGHEGRHRGLNTFSNEELKNRMFDVFRHIGQDTETLLDVSALYLQKKRHLGKMDNDELQKLFKLQDTYGPAGTIKAAVDEVKENKDELIEMETRAYLLDIMKDEKAALLRKGPIYRNTKKLITKQYNERLDRMSDMVGEYMKKWREGN